MIGETSWQAELARQGQDAHLADWPMGEFWAEEMRESGSGFADELPELRDELDEAGFPYRRPVADR